MRVHLCDPRHKTVGRHSAYMPVAIGYLVSFAQAQLENAMSFTLHTDPATLIAAIDCGQADVVGLSNYCWNAELSRALGRHAKRVRPESVVVAGGTEFPTEAEEIAAYLAYRSEVDFYVYNYEGEVTFASILADLQRGLSPSSIKMSPPCGVACLDPSGRLTKGAPPERLKSLDVIPSPILSGMMDRFLCGDFMPFLETTRGCPYACTFCVQGDEWYSTIARFSTERITEELRYIAERMAKFPDVPLALADSNFGMYPHDVKTAEAIAELQREFDWPRSFIVDTGKSQLQRLIEVAKKLNRRISMSISPQSMNIDTLKTIKRTNLGGSNVREVYERMKRNGITTNAAIIVPLPEETKESYIAGLRSLAESHVEQPLAYTTMLLKGTALASKESRQRHAMVTRFRMLPRQFGEYLGERVFEFDEVCVATNTMSFEDYIECRGVSFVFLVMSSTQFDFLRPVCRELGVDWFDVLLQFWQAIKVSDGPLGSIYADFIAAETQLFDSVEDMRRFIAADENYARLLSGELGENVMRNFVPKVVVNHFCEAADLMLLLAQTRAEPVAWLGAVSTWSRAVRDIFPMLELQLHSFEPVTFELEYDIEAWYGGGGNRPISDFSRSVRYEATADRQGIERAVAAMNRLYGMDMLRWSSRLLEAKPVCEMWRRCRSVDQSGLDSVVCELGTVV